jgi:hypothetical protein
LFQTSESAATAGEGRAKPSASIKTAASLWSLPPDFARPSEALFTMHPVSVSLIA